MRAIEIKMLDAIKNRANFKLDNTQVIYCSDVSAVFLHGNHIGAYMHTLGTFRPNLETLKRWPTPTTKSRLRALGVDVSTRKGVTHYNGKPLA